MLSILAAAPASSTAELQYAIELLGTPAGVVVSGLCTALLLFSFTQIGRWVVLGLMLFMSTLGYEGVTLRDFNLIPPLGQLRYTAQPLTMLLLGFLLIPALFSRKYERTFPLGATLAFWLVQVVYMTHIAINVDMTRGVLGLIVSATILVAIGHGLSRWLRGVEDAHNAIRCIAWAGMLFVASTCAQLAVNQSAIIANGRLYAITGNPQHAAVILAILLLPTAFLITSRREKLAMRLAWGALAAMMIVMLIWTGSRTGALSALVGLAMTFRRRIGRLLGAGIVVTAFVFAFLAMFQKVETGGAHLFSRANTRSEVWMGQIESFQSHPIFGEMTPTNWGPRESSYLTIASRSGLVGLAFMMLFLLLLARAFRKLGRLRKMLESPDDRGLVDLASAGMVCILVAAIFEGILVGTLTFMVLAVYFHLGLMKFLIDQLPVEEKISADEQIIVDGYESAF